MCAEITSNKFVSRGERQCVPPRHEGSIVQLGNVTASSRPKFDSATRRLEHGALSFCGGGGERAERVRHFKLAERENRDKSVLSERRKFLTDDSQAPASCLHPPQHIRRANQYAVWTVCGKCGARQTYTSKRTGGGIFCLFFFRFFSHFFSGRVASKRAGRQASKQASKQAEK